MNTQPKQRDHTDGLHTTPSNTLEIGGDCAAISQCRSGLTSNPLLSPKSGRTLASTAATLPSPGRQISGALSSAFSRSDPDYVSSRANKVRDRLTHTSELLKLPQAGHTTSSHRRYSALAGQANFLGAFGCIFAPRS